MNPDTIVAGVAAAIAMISVVSVFYQSRKGWYVNVVAPQRLQWADNLRYTLSEFITAFYEGKELQPFKDKIALYLTPGNEYHAELIEAVNHACSADKDSLQTVIVAAQKALRINWWMVKGESAEFSWEERRREAKVKKKLSKKA